jgi:electron transport complex protein RnfE|tara:strand:+ start:22708 stop:23418 length:711 start_codon:yes stop_codon:yes gene_type:complete
MPNGSYKSILSNGIWENQGLVQFLGLCPLIAVSDSVVKALGLSLATMFVLLFSNVTVSLIKKRVSGIVKIPIFIIIIATFTTSIELLMKVFTYELYMLLGIFVPLIVVNGLILNRAEIFACKNNVIKSAFDGLIVGIGFSSVLIALSAVREILSVGKIFVNMNLLFGSAAVDWNITIFSEGYSFLLFMLPPGAFILLGLLIALKNLINGKVNSLSDGERSFLTKETKRVRTTGPVA